jgi:hypothetical protein
MASEARLANTPIASLDPSLTQDVIYQRLIRILSHSNMYGSIRTEILFRWSLIILTSIPNDFHYRDEIGILPFLPDHDANKESMTGDDSEEPLQLYPFVLQEQRTKLGIPIFCWVPLLETAYANLKEATKVTTGLECWWTISGIVRIFVHH